MISRLSVAAAAALLSLAQAQTAPGAYFITFGDSYSQSGFNISLDKPTAANPIGNPPYPGWTTSGGPNWIDYLTVKYNTTLIYNYNFAYGGATVDASLVAPYEPTVLSLIDQVKEFTDSIASKPASAPWTAENAYFAIWLGVNDVGNSWWLSNETALISEIMDQYFNQTQILYNAGGRNFVFLNVPPTQRTPYMMGSLDNSSLATLAISIGEFNQAISDRIGSFVGNNTGVNAWLVDTQDPFNVVLDNPDAFGYANSTCFDDDGVTCPWWNNYHPAMGIHEMVASGFAAAVGTPWTAKESS